MKAFFLPTLVIVLLGTAYVASAQSTRNYDVESFDEIRISGPFYVTLEKGRPNVELSGDEDVIDDITVKISGSTLDIKLVQDRWSRNSERVEVNITFENVSEISVGGACDVQLRDIISTSRLNIEVAGASKFEGEIDVEMLEVDLSGASRLTLIGSASEQEISLSGASGYDGADVSSVKCEVDGTGASNATVRVSDRLEADLTGASSLGYYGNPQYVEADASGASSVKRRGG